MLRKSAVRGGSQGFTLIELMIVIAIFGILAAILTPVLIRGRFKTYHSACVQNERNISTALQLYSLENKNLYPEDLVTIIDPAKPFIKAIPTCPTNEASYTASYTPSDDNSEYLLKCPGDHSVQLGVGLCDPEYPQSNSGMISVYKPDN
ncbi:MAG: type II secretion system protein [Vulcanimicrobiota bacterium]